MGVGKRLKAILRDKKMTIKELAETSGIPLNTLYSITKRDSERVDQLILQRITDTLGIDVVELVPKAENIISPIRAKDASLSVTVVVPNHELQKVALLCKVLSELEDNFQINLHVQAERNEPYDNDFELMNGFTHDEVKRGMLIMSEFFSSLNLHNLSYYTAPQPPSPASEGTEALPPDAPETPPEGE